MNIFRPLDAQFISFLASNIHKLTDSDVIATFQLVNWTNTCLAMVFSSLPGWTKSTLSECCVLITHQICCNRASTEHRRKLQVMCFRVVILARIKLSVELPYSSTKFEFKFWPKFPILDLKTTSCHMLFVTWSHGFWETTHIDVGTSCTYKNKHNSLDHKIGGN